MAEAIRRRDSIVIPAHAGIQCCWDDTIVIPASARESRVSTITLPRRLHSLMQTNLFNCPVIQAVVFTLIPWILDQVKDDRG